MDTHGRSAPQGRRTLGRLAMALGGLRVDRRRQDRPSSDGCHWRSAWAWPGAARAPPRSLFVDAHASPTAFEGIHESEVIELW